MLNACIRPLYPLTIIGVQIDRHLPERAAPLHAGRVGVRTGDRNRLDSAVLTDAAFGVAVKQRDAFPEDVTGRSAQVKAPLPDSEAWLRRDAGQSGFVIAKHVLVRRSQVVEGSPLLAIQADILALILADQTMFRRRLR